MRRLLLIFALMAVMPLACRAEDKAFATAVDLVRATIRGSCDAGEMTAVALAAQLPVSEALSESRLTSAGQDVGWRREFSTHDGGRIRVVRAAPRGRLRRLSVDYWAPSADGPRPLLATIAPTDCIVRLARRLLYDGPGPAVALEELDGQLRPTGRIEPLNPVLPKGEDPGGVPVALVDSGVNYLLPEIAARLARGPEGYGLGYDYWDMDDRPFDANPARSAFFPQRHGTRTASLLLREAPNARLLPYRYPRPDLSRMAALVEHAAGHGVVILGLSLGSNDAAEWRPFADALARHPEMLFVVSAGNDGRDIDALPVYPAALPLDNIITVASSDPGGGLADGSNWGGEAVDLLVPGENIPVLSFKGRRATASGSSFAAPRIAALAARLLRRNPQWRATELRNAIFALAEALPGNLVRVGFIADPTVN